MKYQERLKKIAKKVGVQGYALMNDRAFCNCQKQKVERGRSAWEAWNECWEEYKEAYNGDPDKWLKAYIPLDNKNQQEYFLKGIKASSDNIRKMIRENLISDVESLRGDSPYTGASIRNVLRSYAVYELKEKIKKSQK